MPILIFAPGVTSAGSADLTVELSAQPSVTGPLYMTASLPLATAFVPEDPGVSIFMGNPTPTAGTAPPPGLRLTAILGAALGLVVSITPQPGVRLPVLSNLAIQPGWGSGVWGGSDPWGGIGAALSTFGMVVTIGVPELRVAEPIGCVRIAARPATNVALMAAPATVVSLEASLVTTATIDAQPC